MRFLALFLVLLAACDQQRVNSADVALGQKIYAQHCAACHGAKLEGQPNWRDKLPNGRMPAFGGTLSDAEIWAVLAFIYSHWKSKDVLDARAEMLRNARSR